MEVSAITPKITAHVNDQEMQHIRVINEGTKWRSGNHNKCPLSSNQLTTPLPYTAIIQTFVVWRQKVCAQIYFKHPGFLHFDQISYFKRVKRSREKSGREWGGESIGGIFHFLPFFKTSLRKLRLILGKCIDYAVCFILYLFIFVLCLFVRLQASTFFDYPSYSQISPRKGSWGSHP